MKAELITKKEFKPVTIQVTFETERELLFAKAFLGRTSGDAAKDVANKSEIGIEFNGNEGSVFVHTIYNSICDV